MYMRIFSLSAIVLLSLANNTAQAVSVTYGDYRGDVIVSGSIHQTGNSYTMTVAVSVTGGQQYFRYGTYANTWQPLDQATMNSVLGVATVYMTPSDGPSNMSSLQVTYMSTPGGTTAAKTVNPADYGATGIRYIWFDASNTNRGAISEAPAPVVYLPQRKLMWTITNPTTQLQTWAVFQYVGGVANGIAYASKTFAAGQSGTLSIYVAADDTSTYRVAQVDFAGSISTYGGFPNSGTAYGLNADGTTNVADPKFTYLEGALPLAGTEGTVGNYANATPVQSIPVGTSGPGVDNTKPVVVPPAPTNGGSVTVTPGSGGTSTATDAGTATAVQQGANAIITAVNNAGNAARQASNATTDAVNANTVAVNVAKTAIVAAFGSGSLDGVKAAIEAGNTADATARQAEQVARDAVIAETSQTAINAAMADRDARLAASDSAASNLFRGVAGGMTAAKATPTVGTGDPSAWNIDCGKLGIVDINPFTNAWVQEKLPFLNWLVAFFRISVVWSAQIGFYRWLMEKIRENAIAFMHTPSPPPTVTETIAGSNPFTAILGKLGAVFSSLLLAVLLLSSLSTILSVVTTWGTISSLVASISEGTSFLSSATTGLGATSGALGRVVYLVTAYIPVTALAGIATNYIIIETGLVATMPILVFSMRIRRW